MPEVTLIHFTGKDHPDPLYAARLLAFTKNTRLNMTPDGMEAFMAKPEDEILSELEYMATSIPSSWEFVDVVFLISKVSRATAQQITRTRTASFAMQSQRVTDMSQVSWDKRGETVDVRKQFDDMMAEGIKNYKACIESNSLSLEDARDLLPIGVHCNLVAKYNFRNFVDLVKARQSLRVQGPYRETVRQMKEAVLEVWPWAETFFEHPHDKAIKMIEEVALELSGKGAVYRGPAGKLAKAADLLKK